MRLQPFTAVRPHPEHAASVASVPYDVVNRDEAARLAAGNSESFLHVVRPEIDLPPEVDPHDASVYARARDNLAGLIARGILLRDAAAALYLYRLGMDGREQIGVAGCASVDEYERDVIRKHERTRRDKEDDRTRHMLALAAHPEPVLLAHRDDETIDRLVTEGAATSPLYDFEASDGVRHTVWRISETRAYEDAFAGVPQAYVADGHHRCASAARASRQLRERDATPPAETAPQPTPQSADWFPAVLFPAGQLRILAYNRLVKDLNGSESAELLEKLAGVGRLSPAHDRVPPRAGTFSIYLDGRWHLLELAETDVPAYDPIGSLDVALLHARVLEPILGIGDVRTDPRIDFVGGVRGVDELEQRVDSGEMALAVSLHPVTIEQVMAVSDAGGMMPPKSTWFEPKLRSGLFLHPLDS
ncbi:MAG: DUF1015 domain-containing protein [Gemmatimonadetes bacterium]|nr:DUF1015 domain-containing protein [Gemmatimonadota bacterium]